MKLAYSKKDEKTINEKYRIEYDIFKLDINIGLYDHAIIAMASNFGRLLAFLELSDFTEKERDCEEKKIRELYYDWEKRYYSKEEK